MKILNEKFYLNNKMKAFIKTCKTVKNTSIVFMVKAGSINEGKYGGISHFCERPM